MKRRFRAAVLLLVLTVLLTTVVFADSGPKPQLAVRVVHAPQEAYYLDLLDEETYTGAYETDETGLDPALLGKLLPLAQEYGRSNSASMQLLNALRPFLKPEKQGKVERAAHLARLIHLGKKFLSEWEG